MCFALATAWRIIKTFLYESYIIQIRVAMYVKTSQPPMRFQALMCSDLELPKKKKVFLTFPNFSSQE